MSDVLRVWEVWEFILTHQQYDTGKSVLSKIIIGQSKVCVLPASMPRSCPVSSMYVKAGFELPFFKAKIQNCDKPTLIIKKMFILVRLLDEKCQVFFSVYEQQDWLNLICD